MGGYDFGSIAMSGHNNSSFRCFLPCYSPFLFIFFFSLLFLSLPFPLLRFRSSKEGGGKSSSSSPVFHGDRGAQLMSSALDSFADRKFFNCADTELDLDFFNSATNIYVFHRFN